MGRRVLTSLAALYLAGSAGAMDPSRDLSQYLRDRWSAEQGFPGGAVYAMAQTTDGYLWIGAEKGLVRFDGLNFRLFNHANSTALPAGPVIDLSSSPDGDLWIRLQTPNVVRYHNGVFQDVSQTLAQINYPITAMSRSEHGELLLDTLANVILKYRDGNLLQRRFDAGKPNFFVASIAQTNDGLIWLGTRDMGLFSLGQNDVSVVSRGLSGKRINCLLPAGDKELWIGTDTGVLRWNGTTIAEAGAGGTLSRIQVLSLAEDSQSNVWVGTARGLMRITAKGVSALEKSGTMPVRAVLEDREGNIWTGDTQGIERLRDSLFLSYSTPRATPAGNSGPLYVDGEGRTWFAPSWGTYWLRGAEMGRVTAGGLDRDPIYSISGGSGELWAGRQRGGLTRLIEVGGSFAAKTYTRAEGLAQNTVYAVHRSRDGSVWAGTLSGGVSRFQKWPFHNLQQREWSCVGQRLFDSGGIRRNHMDCDRERSECAIKRPLACLISGREGLPSGHVNCLMGTRMASSGSGPPKASPCFIRTAFKSRPTSLGFYEKAFSESPKTGTDGFGLQLPSTFCGRSGIGC